MGHDETGLRFVIIGAGMSGILSVIKLREAGYTDITVYEKASRLGGTWRENTYPGLACDVPSHLYSYSFALNPAWSHVFSPGAEIQAYFEKVADDYDVVPAIRFSEEITDCTWSGGRWQLQTSNGRRDEADVVIAATGVLHVPQFPDIAGLDSFAGPCFHSAQWDHTVALAGRRVGIIGTGSTAVQIVSAIVPDVAHLSLFQRTPQWVLPQENPEYTAEQQDDFRRHPEKLRELYDTLSETFAAGFANAVVSADSPQIKMIEDACRANLETNVHDPQLREQLRPNYRAACKRLIISPDFYDAIQQPNAQLVTEGIECIEPGGVRTKDGQLHELDVLVLATGFNPGAFMRPMKINDRTGRSLEAAWTPRPNAYLSVSMPEFPNFFMLNGPNGPVGNFSLIQIAELQFGYILKLVEQIRSGAFREVSATQQAMDDHESARVEQVKQSVWVTGCRSWYLDDRGIPAVWPWPFDVFRSKMAEPDLAHYDMR